MADRRIEALIERSELAASAQADVRAAIDSSPYLEAVMLKGIQENRIRELTASNDPNEGGHYDRSTGAISINADYFGIDSRKDRLDTLTGVLGHEAGHALMARSAEITEHRYAFEVEQALRDATRDGNATVDITPFAKRATDDFRDNEALAELVSMNAVASRVAKSNGAFNMRDFLSRADLGTECIDKGVLEDGIRLNAKGFQLTGGKIESPAVERIAQCHFDDGAKTLGLKGTSSYPDFYAAYTLGAAVDVWNDYARGTTRTMPQIEVNLDTLKSTRSGVENAGVELGGKGNSFDFVDLSAGQRRSITVRQLGEGATTQPDAEVASISRPMLADNPSHPDYGTFQRIHEWVSKTGQWDEEKSRNVAASLYKEQMADPLLQRIDKIAGSIGRDGQENVFAVYAPFGDKPPTFHAHVDGRQAALQPAEQNLEQAEQIRLQQVQQQQLEHQQQQNQQQTQKAPAISM